MSDRSTTVSSFNAFRNPLGTRARSSFRIPQRKSHNRARCSRRAFKPNEDGKRLPLDVKAGDIILFGKYSGQEIKLDGKVTLGSCTGMLLPPIGTKPHRKKSAPHNPSR
jgi:hypothetical protein